MNVTREVITDLLPLYLADEASADTRKLVEEYFEQDPEFARLARSEQPLPVQGNLPGTPTKETEMETLEKTRKLLRLRSRLMAVAIVFSLMSVSFQFDSRGIYWTWANVPAAGAGFLAAGITFWIAYFSTIRRLKGSEL